MDKVAEKQSKINRQQDELIAQYPALWENIIAEWRSPGPDRAWLMYSANYLFRTSEVCWALDPLTLNWRLRNSAPSIDISALRDLSFILLTHRHEDHLDLNLISALKNLSICWVVPEAILSQVMEQGGIQSKSIIVPKPLQPIELNGIRVTPFDGLHWEKLPDGTFKGIPEIAYLVEFNNKRWLFPGDTRNYDASRLPDFGRLDGVFAHLWMGRGCACIEPPPLLESFCNFFASQRSPRIVLTHLMEFGRESDDYWDASHAQTAISFFRTNHRHIEVSYATIGQKVFL